jgi:2'-5' RNA ligase
VRSWLKEARPLRVPKRSRATDEQSTLIGKWFESYDEAWSYFLERETPLEDFWSALPEPDGSILAGWLIEPPPHVKDAVRELLVRLGKVGRVAAVPRHFLHIWIHGVAHDPSAERVSELVDTAREVWAEQRSCEIALRHANCFHDAAVVEAHTNGVPRLLAALNPDADLRVALPHMTVGYLRSPSAASMRDVLADFRAKEFGSFHAANVRLCLIPIARSTFMRPWKVAATHPLLSA